MVSDSAAEPVQMLTGSLSLLNTLCNQSGIQIKYVEGAALDSNMCRQLLGCFCCAPCAH